MGQVPLHAHDLPPVPLEGALGAGGPEKLPLTQKPPKMILEGFHRERVSPARGGCGLRG
jgi:hypothetical protein